MSAVFNILILTFLSCTANAYIKPEEFGEFKKLTAEWHDICSDVTGATDDNIFGIREGRFPDDEKLKRYVWCLWRLAKTGDRNLNLNFNPVLTTFPERMRDANYILAAGECLTKMKKSGLKENYEKIYEFEKCLYKVNPDLFIMW